MCGCILCLNAVALDESRDCEASIFYAWSFQVQEKISGGFVYGVIDMCDQL